MGEGREDNVIEQPDENVMCARLKREGLRCVAVGQKLR